jgi:ribosomal protein L15
VQKTYSLPSKNFYKIGIFYIGEGPTFRSFPRFKATVMKGYTSEVTKVYTAKIWAVLYLSRRSLSALKEDSISRGDRNHFKGKF